MFWQFIYVNGAKKRHQKNLAIPSAENSRPKYFQCRKVPVPKSTGAEKSPRRKVRVSKRARVEMSRDVPDAEIALCRNVSVPKRPRAEMFRCRKGPMPKRSCVEMSICRNVCSAERCTCRNAPVMKYLRRNDSCRNVPCRKGLQTREVKD